MAVLKVIQCKNCTRPLPPGATVCPTCHTPHVVENEVNPLKLPANMAEEYLKCFQNQTGKNPKDTNALFGMGLVYMGLKNYEMAQRNFQMAVDLSPLEPDIYYYFALSLFEGHNPKHLSNTVCNRIEEWLHTATNRHPKRKYLILQMVLRQGAFIANGLQVRGEQPAELMARIRTMMPEADELAEIKEHVRITDPQTLEWLDELQSGKQVAGGKGAEMSDDDRWLYNQVLITVDESADVTGRDDFFYTDDTATNTVDNVAPLLAEKKREEFFKYHYFPNPPRKFAKPGPPVWKAVKLALMYFFLWIVVVIGLAADDFGSATLEVKEKPTDLKSQKAIAELQAIEEEQKAFFDANWVVCYKQYVKPAPTANDPDPSEVATTRCAMVKEPLPDEAQVTAYFGLERSWRGILAPILFFLPFILFLIHLYFVIRKNIRGRQEVAQCNRNLQAKFEHECSMTQTRATKLEYVAFCRNYMAQHSRCLPRTGDPVSQALRENRIDEQDMRGKILFVNYFEWTDHNNVETSDPCIVLRYIYYIIAIPQKDKLLLLKNRWDTLSNSFGRCDMDSVFYKNIISVSLQDDRIVIEKTGGSESGITLPPRRANIFAYQNTDPTDKDTYSATRTSDPKDFVEAINALIEVK